MIKINLKKKKEKEIMKKRTITKNTCYNWYDWLANYIPEPIKMPLVVLNAKS